MDHITFQFSTTASNPFFWTGYKHRWSMVIRRLCHSPFSHVDMMLDDGSLLGASDSANSPVIAGNPRGVAIRPADYEDFGIRRRMVLKTDKADAIVTMWLSQLGKPFDHGVLRDFISSSFPGERDWRDTGKWFCSEGIIWSVEQSGYWSKPLLWPKNRVSPTDMLLIFLFDPNWLNRDTFWQPVPGLILDPGEI